MTRYCEHPDLPIAGMRRAPGLHRPATLEGGKGGGAPAAPDPFQTAQATTGTNEATATWNKNLNLNNYSNPFGSQITTQTGTASDGAPIYGTKITASPELQGQISSLMGQTANSGNINNAALSGLFGLGSSISPQAAQNAQQQGQQAAYGSMMGYLKPQFQQQQTSLDSQLANQGLAPGSQAWDNAESNMSRNQDYEQQQALNNSILTGAQLGTQNWQNQLSGINTQAGLYGQAVGVGQTPYSDLAHMAALVPGNTGTATASAAPADIAGYMNNAYQGQLANYNANQASANQTTQDVVGLGAMAAMAFF